VLGAAGWYPEGIIGLSLGFQPQVESLAACHIWFFGTAPLLSNALRWTSLPVLEFEDEDDDEYEDED